VRVEGNSTVVRDQTLNHGIEVSRDGRLLFASNRTMVLVWDYDSRTGAVTNQRVLLTGMNASGAHATRTLLIPDRTPGSLLVSQGSADNLDMTCVEPTGCMIKEFDISQIPATPYDFVRDGRVLGWGLRNSVGVAQAADGGIWSVENAADELRRDGVDVHADNPADELNYHGRVQDRQDPLRQANFGYPICHAAWDAEALPQRGELETGMQFANQNNASFTDDTCRREFIAPRLAIHAHQAPLDIKFYRPELTGGRCQQNSRQGGLGCEYVDNAFIGFHGSWNRHTPVGYSVAEIPFHRVSGDRLEPRAPSIARDGYRNIFWPRDLTVCESRCFRPVGVAFDREGRLFVSSDTPAEIMVVVRTESTEGSAAPCLKAGSSAYFAAAAAFALTTVSFLF